MGKLPQQLYAEYRGWIERHCWPITAALGAGDLQGAEAALVRAQAAADAEDANPQLADSYQVACLWHDYLIASKRTDLHADAGLSDFLDRAAQLRPTEWGEQCRRKVNLCLRLSAAADNAHLITGGEIRAELDGIDDLEDSVFVWHYVTPWAFINRDHALLRRAYEALVQDAHVQGQRTSFLRVGLLHALVAGTATEQLIGNYLEHLHSHLTLYEFSQNILPECEAQGLITAELRAKIAARRELISRNQGSAAGYGGQR
jgi:hypothetical protein